MFDFNYDLDNMAYLMHYAWDLQEFEPWKSAISKELDLSPGLLTRSCEVTWSRVHQGCFSANLVTMSLELWLMEACCSVVPVNIAAHFQGRYNIAATPDYLLALVLTATAYVIGDRCMHILC